MTRMYTPDFTMFDNDPELARPFYVAHGLDGGCSECGPWSGKVLAVFVRRNDLIRWCSAIPVGNRASHDVTIVQAGREPIRSCAFEILRDSEADQ